MSVFTTCIFELALGSVVFIGGLGLIVSAAKGHKYVIDPPEGAWWFYSQSLLRRIVGRALLKQYTYLLGGILMLGGAVLFGRGILTC